jgi:hypothetical protein
MTPPTRGQKVQATIGFTVEQYKHLEAKAKQEETTVSAIVRKLVSADMPAQPAPIRALRRGNGNE